MAHQMDCPSCGASVRVKRGQVSAVCSYCGSSVIVPQEFRTEAAPVHRPQTAHSVPGCGARAGIVVAMAVFMLIGVGTAIFFMAAQEEDKSFRDSFATAMGGGFSPDLEFGGPGTGRGYFDEPSCIAVDGIGNVYVGENESGRIQVFDSSGEYLRSWSFAEPGEFYLMAMSASGGGDLYMVYDSELFVHSGETGERLDILRHPHGWGFSDVDVSCDGSVAASWYCNRDDIVIFNEQGGVEVLLQEAISGITGDSELSTMVAAGNRGEVFAYGSFNSVVMVFDPHGEFMDRFGNDDTFTMPSGMDVDPSGRLWISDFGELFMYSGTGELERTVDPGISIYDFVIDDDYRLWGITYDDTVVMIDLSEI